MKSQKLLTRIGRVCLGLIAGCALIFLFAEQSLAVKFTSPPASQEYWYAFCNTQGRNVVLGIHKPNTSHVQMAGPFYKEPDARNWVNKSCSSWRCDWNGRCVTPPAGNNKSSCPPGTYLDQGLFGQGSGKCIPY